MGKHEELTAKYSTFDGAKLLQHTDVLFKIQHLKQLCSIEMSTGASA